MTTKNMFKEVNVTKNRGHPGTGLTTAPVLLKTGGKPSTWISAGGTRRASNFLPIAFFFQIFTLISEIKKNRKKIDVSDFFLLT